jgi:hypothetical protein
VLDALNRHRGKGQQKVTVEHVHVHEGGQAIVTYLKEDTMFKQIQLAATAAIVSTASSAQAEMNISTIGDWTISNGVNDQGQPMCGAGINGADRTFWCRLSAP